MDWEHWDDVSDDDELLLEAADIAREMYLEAWERNSPNPAPWWENQTDKTRTFFMNRAMKQIKSREYLP